MVSLQLIGIAVVLIGIFLILAGSTSGKTQASGVIFIGPVPIPFGGLADKKYSTLLWIIGIVLFLAAIIAWLVFANRS